VTLTHFKVQAASADIEVVLLRPTNDRLVKELKDFVDVLGGWRDSVNELPALLQTIFQLRLIFA